jgi:hypothetical protein
MVGAFAIVAAVYVVVLRPSPPLLLDVLRSPREFAGQAADALLPWRWEPAAQATRQGLQAGFGVPPDVLAAVAGRTVHVDPFEAGVATAYPTFTWRPVPIYQSYQAYTPYLDELNADRLRSADRPERILRHYESRTGGGRTVVYALDGRNYWFESPAATVERLCRYREVVASGDWQVLADTGHACGTVTPLGGRTVALGETVDVPTAPSADSFVLVRITGLDAGLLGRLRVALWRAPESFVVLDGGRYRLVPATATTGLVLAVPETAQGSTPFAFGDPVRSISVQTRMSDEDGQVTFEFVAVSANGP